MAYARWCLTVAHIYDVEIPFVNIVTPVARPMDNQGIGPDEPGDFPSGQRQERMIYV